MTSFDWRGSLALAGSVIAFAAMPVFLRELTHHVDAWTANGIRYPFASLLYLPIIAGACRSGALDRSLLARAVVPAFLSLGGQVLWALAPYHLPASLIGFLIKASILWGLAGAMILFREERALLRRPSFHAGLILAAAGFVALALSPSRAEPLAIASDPDVTTTGLVIILGCSAFFGLYGVSVRRFLQDTPPALAFGVVSLYVSAGTLAFMGACGDTAQIASLPGKAWWLLVVSSFLGIALSHWLYYDAIQRLGPSIAMGVHLLGPFVTLALANLALGEEMGPSGWGAGTVMLAGAGLLLRAQRRAVAYQAQDRV